MRAERSTRTRGLTRRGPAVLAAALALAALGGTGRAAATTADIISTVAGGPGGPGPGTKVAMIPCGVSSGGGHVYIPDTTRRRGVDDPGDSSAVREMSPSSSELTTVAGNNQWEKYANGGVATGSYLLTCGTALDKSGNLIVADYRDQRIRVVAATTGTFYGQAMTAGHIYSIAGNGKHGFSGDGGPATEAEMSDPGQVTVDSAGNLLFGDRRNNRVRVVAGTTGTFYGIAMTAGDIYTVAGDGAGEYSGDGGPATQAGVSYPAGVAVDHSGNLLIADDCRIRVVAGTTGTFYGIAMTAGDIYTVAGDGACEYSGDGAPATDSGAAPDGVTVDSDGNLVIADSNDRVRVVAASTGTFYGQAMTAGFIYTIAGDGQQGFAGDRGPATNAKLNLPQAVAMDSDGNVLVADTGNNRVRVIAAGTGTFYGIAMTAGDVYTIAGTGNPGRISGLGGPATSAELASPYGPALDAAGNVLFDDSAQIHVVAKSTGTFYGQAMTVGDLYTVAGTGRAGFSGDGGPATKAELSDTPGAVTVDASGNW